jgi:hypothetical protein
VTLQLLNQETARSVERNLQFKLAETELRRLAKAARSANASFDRASVPSPHASLTASLVRSWRSLGRGLDVAARRRMPA